MLLVIFNSSILVVGSIPSLPTIFLSKNPKPPLELVQVGSYLRQDQAEERGLVVLALGFPYWVFEEDGLYGLYVDAYDTEPVTLELEKFEAEREIERELARIASLNQPPPGPLPKKINPFSLFVFVWTMCLYFGLQIQGGAHWMSIGEANSQAILQGEAWRTLTALTLHADPGHLFANVATGLVFAWALLPLFGSGWTWLGLVLSGAIGNALNAAIHRGGDHHSIGASTAVFGGLGMPVGWQIIAAIHRHHGHREPTWRLRQIGFPIGAGLALLAFLGVGNGHDNVDIMAHGLGMICGVPLGILAAWARLPEKTSARLQKSLALAALLLPALGWLLALFS